MSSQKKKKKKNETPHTLNLGKIKQPSITDAAPANSTCLYDTACVVWSGNTAFSSQLLLELNSIFYNKTEVKIHEPS